MKTAAYNMGVEYAIKTAGVEKFSFTLAELLTGTALAGTAYGATQGGLSPERDYVRRGVGGGAGAAAGGLVGAVAGHHLSPGAAGLAAILGAATGAHLGQKVVSKHRDPTAVERLKSKLGT